MDLTCDRVNQAKEATRSEMSRTEGLCSHGRLGGDLSLHGAKEVSALLGGHVNGVEHIRGHVLGQELTKPHEELQGVHGGKLAVRAGCGPAGVVKLDKVSPAGDL